MTAEPTPTLAEYRRMDAEDDNTFWRLSSGDHQNLLEEAIEEIDRQRSEREKYTERWDILDQQRTTVLKLHGVPFCETCNAEGPCETRRVLDGVTVEPRHFAPYGGAFTTCGDALPKRTPWSVVRAEFDSRQYTTRRAETTCPRCRSALGLDDVGLDDVGHLQGLQVAHDAPGAATPGDGERLTLDRAADVLHQWADDLTSGHRREWPHGEREVIRGIQAAADWVRARHRYEAKVREQQAAAMRANVADLKDAVRQIGQAWRDGMAKARADIEARRAEPTLRDVMAAAHRARLRLHCDIDDAHTDGNGDEWRHREYSVVPLGRDGGELGRLTYQVGTDWTHVGIETREGRLFSTLTDPTPREALDAARAAGLIGDTDA